MELINKLLDAQAKVGKKAALVQPAKKVEAEESKGEAHNHLFDPRNPPHPPRTCNHNNLRSCTRNFNGGR